VHAAAPPSGRLHDPRFATTATVLANGQVLITGGVAADSAASAVAELYDPATGGFSFIGSLLSGRAYHTATLLANGKVLIAGGVGIDGHPVRASELYDPASGAFVPTGNMIEPRYDHAATALPNGKVLITGGSTTTRIATNSQSAELYNPATGAFSATGEVQRYYDPEANQFWHQGKMNAVRTQHTATLLPNGKVLLAGGGDTSGTAQASAEIYDPASGEFTPAAPMNAARKQHHATLLLDGQVLVTGGIDAAGQVLAAAELFDPKTGRFKLAAAVFPNTGGNMLLARYEDTATLLNDGRVLLAGGSDSQGILDTAEIYDPSRGSFECAGGRANSSGGICGPSMTAARDNASAVRLSNGEVLILGGFDTTNFLLSSAEIYNPPEGSFTSVAAIVKARYGGSPSD